MVNWLGIENQWVPVLILGSGEKLIDPIKITEYLAANFGTSATAYGEADSTYGGSADTRITTVQ